MYDPFTARWTAVDPLARKYPSLCPFLFCNGNSISFYDPNGSSIRPGTIIKVVKKTYKAVKKSEKLRLGATIAEEFYSLVDDAETLTNPESTGFQKGLAVFDLATGLGEEAKLGLKAFGVSDAIFKLTSRGTLRRRMVRVLDDATSVVGKQAHHMLPWEHRKFFAEAGLDINDPKYGIWLDSTEHLSKAKEYNKAWSTYINNNRNATAEEIVEEMKKLMKEIYGKEL